MANFGLNLVVFSLHFIVADAGEYCYYGYSTAYHYIYGFYYCYDSCCGYYTNRYCCSSSTATIAGAVIGGVICLAVIVAIVACCIMASKTKHAQRNHTVSPGNISVVQFSPHRQQPISTLPAPPPYSADSAHPPGYSSYRPPSTNARIGSPPPKYSDPPPVYS